MLLTIFIAIGLLGLRMFWLDIHAMDLTWLQSDFIYFISCIEILFGIVGVCLILKHLRQKKVNLRYLKRMFLQHDKRITMTTLKKLCLIVYFFLLLFALLCTLYFGFGALLMMAWPSILQFWQSIPFHVIGDAIVHHRIAMIVILGLSTVLTTMLAYFIYGEL